MSRTPYDRLKSDVAFALAFVVFFASACYTVGVVYRYLHP